MRASCEPFSKDLDSQCGSSLDDEISIQEDYSKSRCKKMLAAIDGSMSTAVMTPQGVDAAEDRRGSK